MLVVEILLSRMINCACFGFPQSKTQKSSEGKLMMVIFFVASSSTPRQSASYPSACERCWIHAQRNVHIWSPFIKSNPSEQTRMHHTPLLLIFLSSSVAKERTSYEHICTRHSPTHGSSSTHHGAVRFGFAFTCCTGPPGQRRSLGKQEKQRSPILHIPPLMTFDIRHVVTSLMYTYKRLFVRPHTHTHCFLNN